MSRLTPAERATLLGIEAQLIAQDPSLAVRMRRLWGMSAVASPAARQVRRIPRPPTRSRPPIRPCPAEAPAGRAHAKLITVILIAALAVAGAISVAALVLTASQQPQAAASSGTVAFRIAQPAGAGRPAPHRSVASVNPRR